MNCISVITSLPTFGALNNNKTRTCSFRPKSQKQWAETWRGGGGKARNIKNGEKPIFQQQSKRKPFAISTSPMFHVFVGWWFCFALCHWRFSFFSLNHFLRTMTFCAREFLELVIFFQPAENQHARDVDSASISVRHCQGEFASPEAGEKIQIGVLPKINFYFQGFFCSAFRPAPCNGGGVKYDAECVRNAFSNLIKWHRRIIRNLSR